MSDNTSSHDPGCRCSDCEMGRIAVSAGLRRVDDGEADSIPIRNASCATYDFTPWKPPFQYFPLGTDIRDSAGQKCLDIRGWGFLTGRGGGLAMDEDKAAGIQDALGAHVVALLNASSVGHGNENQGALTSVPGEAESPQSKQSVQTEGKKKES